jgi:hypothetical protein
MPRDSTNGPRMEPATSKWCRRSEMWGHWLTFDKARCNRPAFRIIKRVTRYVRRIISVRPVKKTPPRPLHSSRLLSVFSRCVVMLSASICTQRKLSMETLPTYQWLSDAGIKPSSSKKHTLSDLTSALHKAAGVRRLRQT